MVNRLKTMETGLALAKVLDLLVNEQDPPLTSCPKTRVHLRPALQKNRLSKKSSLAVGYSGFSLMPMDVILL